MKPNDYSDQTKIFDPQTWSWPVHLIGAGGINNLVAPVLAKMGITELHVWDDDILESRNLPTEVAYSATMCGHPKVAAMADTLYYLMPNGINVYQHEDRVTADTKLSGVVISGVDSMASRQAIWQCVQDHYLDIPFYIDGRSGGEKTQVFAFSPANFNLREDYETWLFNDDEAAKLQCGARNIGYISAYLAGDICRAVTMFHRGIEVKAFPIQHDYIYE